MTQPPVTFFSLPSSDKWSMNPNKSTRVLTRCLCQEVNEPDSQPEAKTAKKKREMIFPLIGESDKLQPG